MKILPFLVVVLSSLAWSASRSASEVEWILAEDGEGNVAKRPVTKQQAPKKTKRPKKKKSAQKETSSKKNAITGLAVGGVLVLGAVKAGQNRQNRESKKSETTDDVPPQTSSQTATKGSKTGRVRPITKKQNSPNPVQNEQWRGETVVVKPTQVSLEAEKEHFEKEQPEKERKKTSEFEQEDIQKTISTFHGDSGATCENFKKILEALDEADINTFTPEQEKEVLDAMLKVTPFLFATSDVSAEDVELTNNVQLIGPDLFKRVVRHFHFHKGFIGIRQNAADTRRKDCSKYSTGVNMPEPYAEFEEWLYTHKDTYRRRNIENPFQEGRLQYGLILNWVFDLMDDVQLRHSEEEQQKLTLGDIDEENGLLSSLRGFLQAAAPYDVPAKTEFTEVFSKLTGERGAMIQDGFIKAIRTPRGALNGEKIVFFKEDELSRINQSFPNLLKESVSK